MKGKNNNIDEEFHQILKSKDKELISSFFDQFNISFKMNKHDKRELKRDFEKIILYYFSQGYSVSNIVEILDLKRLGNFYSVDAKEWFPLDDSAKIYPLSMAHGKMSVFRLSTYLKEDVIPEILQTALTFTIKRFPSFATTLKNGFFWHYLDSSKRRYFIEEEVGIPCQEIRVSLSRSQTFRVLYFKNRISVEFFHVLTDGSGGMVFMKALISEYFRLLGVKNSTLESGLNLNELPHEEEFSNEFRNVFKKVKSSNLIDKPAIQINGKLSKNNPCRVIHFNIETDKLKEVCNKYNVTVTAYFLALIMLASKATLKEMKNDFNIQVPVNMRKFYPSKTVRNFSLYCGIRMPVEEVIRSNKLFSVIDEQLKIKSNKNAMDIMGYSAKRLVHNLRWIPLEIKRIIIKYFYKYFADNNFTATFSNLGKIDISEDIKSYVKSMDFVLGTSFFNRASCSLISVNNVSTFSITKHTLDTEFEEKLYKLLLIDNLNVLVDGSETYED